MKCPKCEGLMFVERFADYFLTFHAWKCINCGSIMDQTILANRSKQPALVSAGSNEGALALDSDE
jgi:ribosomal protein L37AE/L43A